MYLSITYSAKLSTSFNLSDYHFPLTLFSPIQKYYIFSKNTKKSYFVVITAHLLPLTKPSNKATLALHSFSKCSFTLSKLRFFELRAPKISACYTTSRLLVTCFAHRLEIRRALYLHYSNNKVWVAGVCKLRFFELRAPKISTYYTTLLGWRERRWKQEEGGVIAKKRVCPVRTHP